MSLSRRFLVAVCSGTVIGGLGLVPMLSVADSRGYHYEEILNRSHIVVLVMMIAFITCSCSGLLQTLVLATAGGSIRVRLAYFAVLSVGAYFVCRPDLIASAQDRHFCIYSVVIPLLAGSFLSLFLGDSSTQLRGRDAIGCG